MTIKQIQIEIRKHLNIIANSTDKINLLNNMLYEKENHIPFIDISNNDVQINPDIQDEKLFN